MCGIAGIFHRREGRPNPKALDAMTDRIAHRGPDGRGIYIHEGVGFGHRRLSIIGLSDGQQPMCNEDGTIWVTFNGEIYNYLDLKRQLEAKGHVFKSHSDTEVLVHGYEVWGASLPEKLRGIFAFAIHDQKASTLMCVRDRLGVKPFFYHLTDKLFLFGSEPKAILEHPDMPKRPDMGALHLYLRYGYMPPPHSAFEGMKQLEPGSLMIVTPISCERRRYWTPPELGLGDPADVDGTLDRLIDDAVSSELMSEVPLGALLSGGVDSSTVAASMALRGGAPPRTFCIGFPVAQYDESGYSKRIAEHLKLDHHVDIVSKEDLDLLDTLVDVYDEPFADSSAIPTYVLSKLTKQHVTVALSGDGADEVFAGYRRYKKFAKAFELPELGRKAMNVAKKYYPPYMRGAHKLLRLGSTMAQQYEVESTYFPVELMGDLVAPELLHNPGFSIAELFDAAPGQSPVLKAQWCDLMTYLPGDILVKVDRASMAHALEVRVPLLDHVLLEWAFQLPLSKTLGPNLEGKVALKDHLARRIPRSLFERPKMGFGVPLEYWLGTDGGLARLAARLKARAPDGKWLSPLRSGAVDQLIEKHGPYNYSSPIWALLFLEAWWQRQFG